MVLKLHLKLSVSQYKLLSRYAEDLSKTVALYNVAGYFLPSVLPSVTRPSLIEFAVGALVSLTLLWLAAILVVRGRK